MLFHRVLTESWISRQSAPIGLRSISTQVGNRPSSLTYCVLSVLKPLLIALFAYNSSKFLNLWKYPCKSVEFVSPEILLIWIPVAWAYVQNQFLCSYPCRNMKANENNFQARLQILLCKGICAIAYLLSYICKEFHLITLMWLGLFFLHI